jgi:CheY-like chemotaxis protein
MSDATPAILLVDDDVDICANMADILADLGYSVDVAHEGEAALELALRRPYDVALLDLRMPGMNGVTLCREIRRVRSGTVAMLVTAYAGGDAAREALDAGAWQVVSKPVDFPRLIGLIDEAAGQPLALVVDDDPDLCANLLDLLRERGYRVCVAHDEGEAIERLRETTRVVLLDLRLPGRDGGVVFRRIREINPSARVVLITGYRSELEPLVGQLVAEGIDAVHDKPLDMPRLLADLDRLTGARVAGQSSPTGY